jgi:hypothetical protein
MTPNVFVVVVSTIDYPYLSRFDNQQTKVIGQSTPSHYHQGRECDEVTVRDGIERL